jgi:predicted amidophosphoribosyltransferase
VSSDPHGDNETVPHLTGNTACRGCGSHLVWGAWCVHCVSPGRLAYETYAKDWKVRPAWEALTPEAHAQWASVEHEVIKQHARTQGRALARGFVGLMRRLSASNRPK